jgi:hypothetical protein
MAIEWGDPKHKEDRRQAEIIEMAALLPSFSSFMLLLSRES